MELTTSNSIAVFQKVVIFAVLWTLGIPLIHIFEEASFLKSLVPLLPWIEVIPTVEHSTQFVFPNTLNPRHGFVDPLPVQFDSE